MTIEAKRIAVDVMGWMWGTVQGAFNEKMDVSQIVTDAVVGMIPVVGDVTAARDLIAVSLGLAGDEKKRDDTMQWVMLVIFIFALIPVVGGVIKGVGRLALKVTADAAKDAKVLEEVITFLNRVGHGNAVKWLREFKVMQYQSELITRFHNLMDTLINTIVRVKQRLGVVLPERMIAVLEQWRAGFVKLRGMGDKMIPKALKELNARLLRLQQLVYRGEWHTVAAGEKTATREAEARLVENTEVAAKASAHGGWKQNAADPENLEKISKIYKWQEGYPDLMKKKGSNAFGEEVYQSIAAFSGSIKASKVTGGDYILRVHIPGSAVAPWWVRLPHGVTETNWREFLQNGKQWREGLAVLDEFSKNGAFSICRVKPGQSINAWEGKAAEQFGMQNPGQYLPGGMPQIYTEAWSESFNSAVEWVVREGKTGWTDLEGVGYAAGNIKTTVAARAERLAEDEDQTKRPAATGTH